MRKLGLALATSYLLAALVSAQSARPATAQKLFMWEVNAPGAPSTYLLGSLHLLSAEYYPLPDPIERAFKQSNILIEEVDIDEMTNPAAAFPLLAKSIFTDGRTLEQVIAPELYKQVVALGAKAGIPVPALQRMKPWMAAITLAVAPLGKLGYEPGLGVEKVLSAAAKAEGKSIGALETPEQQLQFFNSLPEDQQIAFLNSTIEGLAEVEQNFSSLVESWAMGEPEQLADKMNESLEATPELAQTLLFQRNENWARQIKAMLDQPGAVFVAVGAGHLAGERSLQDYLKAAGVRTERVPHQEE